jgi:hypothetical protein
MAETTTIIPPETTSTVTSSSTVPTEEQIWISIMEQNLEGVMFHSFEVDFYTMLDLKGFKRMHEHQVADETNSLKQLKCEFIKEYKKLPILKSKGSDLWSSHAALREDDLSQDKVIELVKKSMEAYAKWEAEVLEHLLEWKRSANDKKTIHSMVEDVMQEIKYVETIIDVLEEHDYNYDCIQDMSNYLYQMY